jgi:hypothetical protein
MVDINMTMLFMVFGVGALLTMLVSGLVGIVGRPAERSRETASSVSTPAGGGRQEAIHERQRAA